MTTKKTYKLIQAYRHDFTIESVHDEEIDVRSYLYMEKEYDEKGNLIREVNYDESGDYNECFSHEYDDLQRITVTRNFFTEEEVAETTHFEYERESNLPIRAAKIYGDGSKDLIVWKYDQENRLIAKMIINEDEETEEAEYWTYSEDREIKYEKLEMDEVVFKEEKRYDEDGRVTAISYYDGENDQTVVSIPIYDEEGRESGMEQYDQNKRKIGNRTVTAYEGSHPTEMIITDERGRQRIIRITYNEHGQELSLREYDGEDQLLNETTRTYHENGEIAVTEVLTNRMGAGINQHYKIEYQYIE